MNYSFHILIYSPYTVIYTWNSTLCNLFV